DLPQVRDGGDDREEDQRRHQRLQRGHEGGADRVQRGDEPVGAVLAGSLLKASLVWDLSDIANAFMAVPNLIALLGLSGAVAAETKKFREELTSRDP
ncbi:MAG TPA: alanine:cation symporter family protein, partial [Verrucomicrobiales bacterium]|nr:alanine:cation symporter family protein [Verrucomicrobiales bacterium]